MHFDFSSYPVVDCHAHPFMPTREKKIYGRRYVLANDNFKVVESQDITTTLSYRMILIELARILGIDKNIPDEEILKERKNIIDEIGYQKYVEKLFVDANIKTYLNETGFPIQGKRLEPREVKMFEDATKNIDVREIIRLEMTCNHIVQDNLPNHLSFDTFLSLFRENIDNRIHTGNVVALKTTIGYFSGLEILEQSKADAEKAFDDFYYSDLSGLTMLEKRLKQKSFRDYMVYEFVEMCRMYHIPLQIHTGAGDPPSCDLRLMHPGLLYEFLNRKDTGTIPIALLHAGYPFSEEMTFMVNGYSNVVTDVSSMTADDSIAVERILPMLLEKVPLSKIMYGSDGAGDVDPIWFAAINFKKVLGRVFDSLLEKDVFTATFAKKAGALILSENAERFYGL